MNEKTARVPRFHVPAVLREGGVAELGEEAARHAVSVLRIRAGDTVILFNGNGGEYEAAVTDVARRTVRLAVGAWRALECESPLAVTLIQGISGGERMDFTVQKAVELGVAAIQPMLTQRSLVRLSPERAASRQAHWQRIAIASCEQCGRNRVPIVREPLPVADFLRRVPDAATRLLLAPQAEQRLRGLDCDWSREVLLAAGPEAGFSPEEEALLVSAGFVAVRLGPRVLRTETAAPAALAALAALYGDG